MVLKQSALTHLKIAGYNNWKMSRAWKTFPHWRKVEQQFHKSVFKLYIISDDFHFAVAMLVSYFLVYFCNRLFPNLRLFAISRFKNLVSFTFFSHWSNWPASFCACVLSARGSRRYALIFFLGWWTGLFKCSIRKIRLETRTFMFLPLVYSMLMCPAYQGFSLYDSKGGLCVLNRYGSFSKWLYFSYSRTAYLFLVWCVCRCHNLPGNIWACFSLFRLERFI